MLGKGKVHYHSYLKVCSLSSKFCQSTARINFLLWWFCERYTDCITQAIL
jgi:hypothetical protein